jgi:hypothetical protein
MVRRSLKRRNGGKRRRSMRGGMDAAEAEDVVSEAEVLAEAANEGANAAEGANAEMNDETKHDTIDTIDLLPIKDEYPEQEYIDLYKKFFKEDPILNNNNTISEEDKRSVYDKILNHFATDFYKLAKGRVELDNVKIEMIISSMRRDYTTKNKINEIFTKLHKETNIDKVIQIYRMGDQLYKKIFPEEAVAATEAATKKLETDLKDLETALKNNSTDIDIIELKYSIINARRNNVNKDLIVKASKKYNTTVKIQTDNFANMDNDLRKIYRLDNDSDNLDYGLEDAAEVAAENAKKRFGTKEIEQDNRVAEVRGEHKAKEAAAAKAGGGKRRNTRRHKKKANQTHHKKRRRNSRKKHNTRRKYKL